MGVVEEIIVLLRMAESEDQAVATLAKMVLGLVEYVKECEARVGVAEGALEIERAKVAALQAAAQRNGGGGSALRIQAKAKRRLAPA